MSYYNDRVPNTTRAHAFVPNTGSPINNQPQWSEDANPDPPLLAGGPMGAYFPMTSARREAGVLWHQPTVPGLGALGLDIGGSLDPNAIIAPVVNALEPSMDRVFNRYMPQVQSTVANAVKTGINQGVDAAWPTVERRVNAYVEPYKKVGIAFGLMTAATLAGVLILLSKKGK